MSEFVFDTTVSKLICLFAIDKMEVPVNEDTIIDMCCISNKWVAQMECRPIIVDLIESGFIYKVVSTHPIAHYIITPEGRICLAHFFVRIPISVREKISEFVKKNRNIYRKRQECSSDYFKNADGTYTVCLKIVEPAAQVLEIKMVVPTRAVAKAAAKQWENKASTVYANVYEAVVD